MLLKWWSLECDRPMVVEVRSRMLFQWWSLESDRPMVVEVRSRMLFQWWSLESDRPLVAEVRSPPLKNRHLWLDRPNPFRLLRINIRSRPQAK